MPELSDSPYTVHLVPVEKIVPSRHQARTDFDEEGIKALAEAIKLEGLLNPINVRPPEGETYELVAGERRLRACRSLGWIAIPALITPVLSEGAAAMKAGMENLQRQELNPIEEAEAFNKPLQADPDHWTQEKVARAFGKLKSYVSESLSLLRLPEGIKKKFGYPNFSRSHGIELARLSDEAKQKEIATLVLNKKLTVLQTRKLIDEALGKPSPQPSPASGEGVSQRNVDPLANVWAMLGWKVHYKGGRRWGFEVDLDNEPSLSGPDHKGNLSKWLVKSGQSLDKLHPPTLEEVQAFQREFAEGGGSEKPGE